MDPTIDNTYGPTLIFFFFVVTYVGLETHMSELEIAVAHWPFSDQVSPFDRANPIC